MRLLFGVEIRAFPEPRFPRVGACGAPRARPPTVGAPGAGLGRRDRGAPALCLPTRTRGGGISTGLMVIYNGKPPLSCDIVLPDRGKKGGTKSPLIISNDGAAAPAASPVPSTATKCSIVIHYIFLRKPSAAHKARAMSLTGSSSLSGLKGMECVSLSNAPSMLLRSLLGASARIKPPPRFLRPLGPG